MQRWNEDDAIRASMFEHDIKMKKKSCTLVSPATDKRKFSAAAYQEQFLKEKQVDENISRILENQKESVKEKSKNDWMIWAVLR